MKLDTTPGTIRAIGAALQLASLLDDRAPKTTRERIAAWAEQVQRHNLAEADMLDAVQAFYDEPRDRAISVGDLISQARRIKRDRLDREEDAERDRRRAEVDPKADDDDMQLFAAGIDIGPTPVKTNRLVAAERALQCAVDKSSAQEAIREYFAAKREAKGQPAA